MSQRLHRLDRSRMLRRMSTDAEAALWELVRDRRFKGRKFRRQFPIGNYIVDFVCLEARLVVEADGRYHEHTVAWDRTRDEWIASHGFLILRFSNEQILHAPDAVMALICQAVQRR